jgi:hypothetical protein
MIAKQSIRRDIDDGMAARDARETKLGLIEAEFPLTDVLQATVPLLYCPAIGRWRTVAEAPLETRRTWWQDSRVRHPVMPLLMPRGEASARRMHAPLARQIRFA